MKSVVPEPHPYPELNIMPWLVDTTYQNVAVKNEPMDDSRHDSGVTSGSASTSPDSYRSDSHPSTSPHQDNVYAFASMAGGGLQGWYPPTSQPSTSQSMQMQPPSPTDSKRQSPDTPELGADDTSNDFDDEGIAVPKLNSHGKVKINKCKHCEFQSFTKLEFWKHYETHIKSDRILRCTKCAFVTEYKHHLEYHLLNHAGAKPFKCRHCDYSCVNKSMLNSHLKSHSKVYQYRCSNCQYETKYCHSLKLHLRKYNHKPAMVLNPDGSPNPLPIIDVYGTRRGPKVKKSGQPEASTSKSPSTSVQQVEVPPAPMPFNFPPFALPFLPGFPEAAPNPDVMLHLHSLFKQRLEELTRHNLSQPIPEPEQEEENGALDLTNKSSHSSESGESDDENMREVFENVEVVESRPPTETENIPVSVAEVANREGEFNNNSYGVSNNNDFACQYCGINFEIEVMFRVHMGYHGYMNPFTCNMCGAKCGNKVDFFLHIARTAHN